jgi:UDP-N-acetylmuramoyl-tripeptide--D-alanyl-D-alanine ligase
MGELSSTSPMSPWSFAFQAGSPGMVSNLALVVQVALHLGVPPDTLQRQLEVWRPFKHRGQTVFSGDSVYYVDCYNANPGSVIDSAKRFDALFPGRQRLYVFGSMNELGPESGKWHRETGQHLELPVDAEVYLIGHGADLMAQGLMDSGMPASQIHVVAELDPIRCRLRTFNGAVFLKGSRTYGLETLLPGEATC